MVSENDRKTITALAGAQTEFEFDFYIQDENELSVYYVDTDGTDYHLTKGVDYTVQDIDGDDFDDGGQITVIVPAAGYSTGKIVILGDTDRNQETDYINNEAIEKQVYEDSLDKLTIIANELAEKLGRALLFGVSETGETAPAEDDRKSKFLAFDADGDPIASPGSTPGTVAVSTLAQTLLGKTTEAQMLTLLGVTTFAQTLLGKTTEAQMLTLLGVSSFVQTLIDDADAATFRNSLNVRKIGDEVTIGDYLLSYNSTDQTLEISYEGS